MLKEAIEFVFNRGVEEIKAAKAQKFDVPGDGRMVLIEHNGQLTERPVPPPLRRHTVDSVDDLIAAVKRWGLGNIDVGDDDGVLWISEERIVLVTNDSDRRETVTLPLVHSSVFAKVKSLSDHNTARMDQPTLIRLLRRDFRHADGVAELLAAVRKIKFRQLEQGYSDVQHGNESMGNAIEAEVSGAGDIADTLIVPVNVFSNPGEREFRLWTVGLDLEIDAKSQRFILRPMPDEVELAVSLALESIRERLTKALPETPVFFGTP